MASRAAPCVILPPGADDEVTPLHVTIGLGVGTLLLVVNDDHVSNFHGYRDTGPHQFWGHDVDIFTHLGQAPEQ